MSAGTSRNRSARRSSEMSSLKLPETLPTPDARGSVLGGGRRRRAQFLRHGRSVRRRSGSPSSPSRTTDWLVADRALRRADLRRHGQLPAAERRWPIGCSTPSPGATPEEPPPHPEEVRDLVGEFANMVCGAWLTRAANDRTFALEQADRRDQAAEQRRRRAAHRPDGRHRRPAVPDRRALLRAQPAP